MAGYPAIDDGRPGYALDESTRASTISAHIAGALVRTREQRRRETVARYPTTPRRNVLRPGRSTHVRVHCSEACSFADRPDPTVRAAAVEALVVSAAQDRSVVSFADGEIGPTAARCKVTPKGLADPETAAVVVPTTVAPACQCRKASDGLDRRGHCADARAP